MITALADTSFVIAVLDTADSFHKLCVAAYNRQSVIYLPQTTLAEIAYLITRERGNLATALFLARLATTKYRLIALEEQDLQRTTELLTKYADTRIDFVDATIAAVAERLNITRILTLDRRDFGLIRPKHVQQFELLPEKT